MILPGGLVRIKGMLHWVGEGRGEEAEDWEE